MTHGWFCKQDGAQQKHWRAADIWDHYMQSVGQGWINTLNAPVCTTGQIFSGLVHEIKLFGKALRSLFDTVHAASSHDKTIVGPKCDNTTLIELQLNVSSSSTPPTFNAVILREELSKGQRIVQYGLDYYDHHHHQWVALPGVHGQSVGNLLIDWVTAPATASKVRMRCVKAMAVPVYLKSVSVHTGFRPHGDTENDNNENDNIDNDNLQANK
eukprot:Sro923_g220760.1 Alpha-L-fucosidase 1 (213) ;mRNA; r:28847-29485